MHDTLWEPLPHACELFTGIVQGAGQEMSPHELEAEREQLQATLEEFPTTLVQDRALLASLQTAGDEVKQVVQAVSFHRRGVG